MENLGIKKAKRKTVIFCSTLIISGDVGCDDVVVVDRLSTFHILLILYSKKKEKDRVENKQIVYL